MLEGAREMALLQRDPTIRIRRQADLVFTDAEGSAVVVGEGVTGTTADVGVDLSRMTGTLSDLGADLRVQDGRRIPLVTTG